VKTQLQRTGSTLFDQHMAGPIPISYGISTWTKMISIFSDIVAGRID